MQPKKEHLKISVLPGKLSPLLMNISSAARVPPSFVRLLVIISRNVHFSVKQQLPNIILNIHTKIGKLDVTLTNQFVNLKDPAIFLKREGNLISPLLFLIKNKRCPAANSIRDSKHQVQLSPSQQHGWLRRYKNFSV